MVVELPVVDSASFTIPLNHSSPAVNNMVVLPVGNA
jgi:hypothetical protein